jgi:hypothetical protein
MLYTRKHNEEYNALAEQIINYAQSSGYDDIRADFSGYESPASLTMLNQDVTLTPDFTARRGGSKFYFELVVKNAEKEDQRQLVSKWKALELIAQMKGGQLKLFVPRGSYKYASELVGKHNIEATLIKMSDI